MSTQTSRAVDIEDLDEALYWASTAGARGPVWSKFVDKLLDERLTLTPLPPSTHGPDQQGKQTQQQEKEQDSTHPRPSVTWC